MVKIVCSWLYMWFYEEPVMLNSGEDPMKNQLYGHWFNGDYVMQPEPQDLQDLYLHLENPTVTKDWSYNIVKFSRWV